MSLVSVFDLDYQAGSKPLFSDLSLHVNDGDRIGLVGHNGCGKSTLIRLLTGEFEADAGRIAIQRGLSIGLVEQFLPDPVASLPVVEAVTAALAEQDREAELYRAEGLLAQLGLWDLRDRRLNETSGGQKNLVMFARAVVKEPELLLLDEPGNHMDSKAMFYLKRYLDGAQVPAFIMISHDRDLLDGVTDRTVWLRDERAYSFDLPYSQAREALAAQDDAAQRRRATEERKIGRLQSSADRIALWGKVYDSEKFARKAKSMQKRIDRLAAEKTFVSGGSGLSLQVDSDFLKAKQAFIFENETIYSPDRRALFVVEELNFRPGDRIALLGVNGSGKSSCIESLMRVYAGEAGERASTRLNPNLRIGYFDQELAHFDVPLGMLDWVREHCSASEESIKRALIHWGFPFREQTRRVNVLSGGERARLMLMTFQLDQPNLLIMDEPTNHIDLQGKEELEVDLQQPGISLLFTSHDQRFIETIATRFWWIDAGRLLEIHDPSQYFDSLKDASPDSIGESRGDDRLPNSAVNSTLADEDALLERVCELERLLAADKARKLKFQKPQRRQQWQTELDTLMQQMK